MTPSKTRIALVTGGSRGLGREMALQLARQGRDVIVPYHSRAAEAAAVVREIEGLGRKAAALQLDTGVTGSFQAFARALDEILRGKWQREKFDYLVNNAGIADRAPFAETTEVQFDGLMTCISRACSS